MNIQSAAAYVKQGYRIRRSLWDKDAFMEPMSILLIDDLLANDWEIITANIIRNFPTIIYSD